MFSQTNSTNFFRILTKFFLQNEKSASPTKTDGNSTPQMIMPKKKTSQPLVAQDGVRSDLLKAIRDGKLMIDIDFESFFKTCDFFRHCFEEGRTA